MTSSPSSMATATRSRATPTTSRAATTAATLGTKPRELADRIAASGADYVATGDLVAQLMAKLPVAKPEPVPVREIATSEPAARAPRRVRPIAWAAVGAALAASAAGIYVKLDHRRAERTATGAPTLPEGAIGSLTTIARAAADHDAGVSIKIGSGEWRPLHAHDALAAGAMVRTDERTRATFDLADGTHLVLDHQTELAFDASEPRHVRIAAGRLLADVTHIDGHPAQVATPTRPDRCGRHPVRRDRRSKPHRGAGRARPGRVARQRRRSPGRARRRRGLDRWRRDQRRTGAVARPRRRMGGAAAAEIR